jgi:sorbitol/mannitol transport system permease protein
MRRRQPPKFLTADWTLENYAEVWARSDYFHRFFWNSVVISVGSTACGPGHRHSRRLGHGLRAGQEDQGSADVDAVHQDDARGRGDGPAVPHLPRTGLIDTLIGLVIALMLMNLPIIVWMLYTYFKEIPGEILEAARMDGATLWTRSSMS